MSTETNKAIVRRIIDEVLSAGNLELVDELFAPDHVTLSLPPEMREGIDGMKKFFHYFRQAFPDGQHTIHSQIAEGDQVATRVTASGTHQGLFLGIPATGRQVQMDGVVFTRFSEGKVSESWAIYDDLATLKQLAGMPN